MEGQQHTAAAIFSVILLIVGFAIAGLLFTFTTVLSAQTFNLVEDDIDAITSYSEANHTFVADNTSWVLINASLKSSTLVLYNTTGYTDNTTAFDVNYTTGYVLLNPTVHADNKSLNGTTMCCVYEYDDGTIRNAVKGGILSNFEAQQQIGDYMPIIALAIIITIVIGLIIGGIASKFMGPGGMMLNQQQGGYGGVL